MKVCRGVVIICSKVMGLLVGIGIISARSLSALKDLAALQSR